jgi:hypothetical protein
LSEAFCDRTGHASETIGGLHPLVERLLIGLPIKESLARRFRLTDSASEGWSRDDQHLPSPRHLLDTLVFWSITQTKLGVTGKGEPESLLEVGTAGQSERAEDPAQ